MLVNGYDCSLVIKTSFADFDVPFSNETLREAVSLLREEAAIEGNGVCRAIAKTRGLTGCVVTPLSIETAPLLLCLAMGAAGLPAFVSETRNLYRYSLSLLPLENSALFDLAQYRGGARRLFENCAVSGFELRINRGEVIKLKLDVINEQNSINNEQVTVEPQVRNNETRKTQCPERFHGDFVSYVVNGFEYKNIYGFTLASRKEGGSRTEIWIKRALEAGKDDLPGVIDELVLTAQLRRERYENRIYGAFRVTLKRLVLVSDETEVNAPDGVVGPLRFYVSGPVHTEVFADGGVL